MRSVDLLYDLGYDVFTSAAMTRVDVPFASPLDFDSVAVCETIFIYSHDLATLDDYSDLHGVVVWRVSSRGSLSHATGGSEERQAVQEFVYLSALVARCCYGQDGCSFCSFGPCDRSLQSSHDGRAVLEPNKGSPW